MEVQILAMRTARPVIRPNFGYTQKPGVDACDKQAHSENRAMAQKSGITPSRYGRHAKA